jgi:hypothetical protein
LKEFLNRLPTWGKIAVFLAMMVIVWQFVAAIKDEVKVNAFTADLRRGESSASVRELAASQGIGPVEFGGQPANELVFRVARARIGTPCDAVTDVHLIFEDDALAYWYIQHGSACS